MKILSVVVNPIVVGTALLSLLLVSCATTSTPVIEFGDDSSEWAHDGECDDPRFSGPGSASSLSENAYHDASDCRDLYQRGRIQLAAGRAARRTQEAVYIDGMDFGDDSSNWAYNGECDDPRFSGPGAARKLAQVDRFHDATDCSNLYQSGRIQLAPGEVGTREEGAQTRLRIDGIDFGDDSSSYAFDDQCDDSRFSGDGSAGAQSARHRFRDATDCSTLYRRGLLRLRQDPATITLLPLPSGATQRGRLPGGGYVDYYRYQGNAGAIVMLDLNSSAFDTYLTLASPSGERWSNDDFDDDVDHSRLMLRLSETGEYQVEVAGYSTTDSGAYTLTLTSASLIADDVHEGSLQRGDEVMDKGEYVDTWSFTAKRGELVSISVSSDDFDTFLILKAPDGKIETNDDAGDNCALCDAQFAAARYNSLIERELSVAGTYTVRVSSYAAGQSGDYRLRILRSESLTNH
ncbi:MAG: PPC domain-containing protein [Pseudomonadales bacterium]|jgi:hypothetical protein|nr:PPC domain-containing protein [Pseudomonadales bacterium]